MLRARLDELDDKIHDLLMERALVVESVARSGKAAAFRPGREAAILRRLLARHTGKLPAADPGADVAGDAGGHDGDADRRSPSRCSTHANGVATSRASISAF